MSQDKPKWRKEHERIAELDRPKGFVQRSTMSTQDYVREWCAENGLKHDAETERLKKAKRSKRTAGPKGKLP